MHVIEVRLEAAVDQRVQIAGILAEGDQLFVPVENGLSIRGLLLQIDLSEIRVYTEPGSSR